MVTPPHTHNFSEILNVSLEQQHTIPAQHRAVTSIHIFLLLIHHSLGHCPGIHDSLDSVSTLGFAKERKVCEGTKQPGDAEVWSVCAWHPFDWCVCTRLTLI